MGGIISKPKAPKPPPQPTVNKELEAQKKAELERAEAERLAETQKRLREDTALHSRGRSKKSLLTRGREGFSLRSLLGGG